MSRGPIAATGRVANYLIDPLFSNAFEHDASNGFRERRRVAFFGSRPSGMGSTSCRAILPAELLR